ncbi:MAG: hypothetical protein HW421_3292 [Ignavibacteria bacterium]|nr:hypothetical protein [Ignavibacteria bacterium]
MKLTYDEKYNIAYLYLNNEMNNGSKIELNSVPVSDDVVVDLLPNGNIFGIELLNANSQIKDFKFIFNNSNKGTTKEFEFA